MPIPSETLGLREAADRFGVSVDTLRRRIKDDAMPEAFKAEGKFGTTWVVPIAAMADIADRERWVLRLDIEPEVAPGPITGSADDMPQQLVGAQALTAAAPDTVLVAVPTAVPTPVPSGLPSGVPTPDNPMPNGRLAPAADQPKTASKPLVSEENLEWVERLLAAETRATGAETRLESVTADAEASERKIAQLTRDIEHERAELRRLRTDLAAEERAKAVSLARTDELRGQLKRDRLDLEARIGVARSDAQTQQERAEELQGRLADTQAAMGWWSRRRLNKISPSPAEDTNSSPGLNR